MDRIEIYTSKKKSFFMLLGAIAFVALGIWMLINADDFTGPRARNPLVTQGIGLASVIFFGFGILAGIKRLINNKLALAIDLKGLTFNPNKSRPDFIAWKDILGFEEIRIHRQPIIIIDIANPDFWIEKETNAFQKKMMQFNLNSYGSPFNIAPAGLNISYGELMEMLCSYAEKAKDEVQQGV
jgi:hypothetical protein